MLFYKFSVNSHGDPMGQVLLWLATLQRRARGTEKLRICPRSRSWWDVWGWDNSPGIQWLISHYPILPDTCPPSGRLRAVNNHSDGSKSYPTGVLGQILKVENHCFWLIQHLPSICEGPDSTVLKQNQTYLSSELLVTGEVNVCNYNNCNN